jgi:molybdate transport system ATP-binding protein
MAKNTARPFLSLEDISLCLYGEIFFEHTNWEILDNQQWAVVGPNGSGKSTLMKALCGRVPIVQGKITYHFTPSHSLPHQDVAYVSFDGPSKVLRHHGGFHQARWNIGSRETDQSVIDYLNQGLKTNPFQVLAHRGNQKDIVARCHRVASLLGIQSLLHKEWIQLSDGERRKVALARALLRQPRLLILDNPFTGLDVAARQRLAHIVDQLANDHVQTIVVTARKSEIPSTATHILSVCDRQVAAQGAVKSAVRTKPPGRLFSSPAVAVPLRSDTEWGPTSRPVLVRMRGVSVSYNGNKVLDNVNWTIRQGQHWALLGPNGAGKSTLLGLILGDHPQAYANDIALFGRQKGVGESIWEIKQKIGWVSPELHLYYPKHLSCLDVVCSGFFDSVGLYGQCTPDQRRQAKAWMSRLHVADQASVPFAQISEGEQRLVLTARAIVKQPLLLILDEPCQGLDEPNRRRTLDTVSDVGDQFKTSIVYVTHDATQLPSIISHVMTLERGRVTGRCGIHELPSVSCVALHPGSAASTRTRSNT